MDMALDQSQGSISPDGAHTIWHLTATIHFSTVYMDPLKVWRFLKFRVWLIQCCVFLVNALMCSTVSLVWQGSSVWELWLLWGLKILVSFDTFLRKFWSIPHIQHGQSVSLVNQSIPNVYTSNTSHVLHLFYTVFESLLVSFYVDAVNTFVIVLNVIKPLGAPVPCPRLQRGRDALNCGNGCSKSLNCAHLHI